ncbi:hypothetical protein E2C01_056832 [Portunus trituberculatus]|uniref:Uncharacterized protein n=1 Tax=Portunus trituberculatus TaxID=210409 RepID=A0A5B7GRE5_PORTR|nr:hypothetical protein [Portunus trituberculatus]
MKQEADFSKQTLVLPTPRLSLIPLPQPPLFPSSLPDHLPIPSRYKHSSLSLPRSHTSRTASHASLPRSVIPSTASPEFDKGVNTYIQKYCTFIPPFSTVAKLYCHV